jgi:hypothetical protein
LIEELLGLVIANDLRYASLYYDSLPNLKPKNNQSEEDRTMELKPNSKAKKHIISQNVEETFIRTKEEYWDYLLSSSETEGRSYGLLHFAHYILKCFQTKDIVNQNNEFTNVRMEIRTNLIEILENLIDHEKDDESIDFSDHKRMICECLDILPPEDVRKAGKNVSIQGNAHEMAILNPIDVEEKGKAEQYDGNASDTMMLDRQGEQDRIASQELKKNCEEEFVKHIRRYLVNQRINFEDLFNMLILTNSTDFIKNSKLILGIEDSDRALDFLVAIQVRMQRGDIDLADKEELLREKTTLVDFARLLISLEEEHLIKYKGSGKLVHLKTKFKNQVDDKFKGSKMMASSFKTSDSLRASYQRFVTDYVKIFLENDHYDKELSFWVTKVLEHCDIQKGIEEPLAFLRALQKVFIKSNKKFFLLRTFRQMMDRVYLDFKRSNSNSVVTGETENEKFDQFNAFQNLLDEAEVPVLCLSVINEANDYIMVDEACNILCLLLKEGNSKVQESVFRTFEENIFTQGFFAYFKERLDLGLEEIRGELANPLKDRSILELDHKLLMQRFKILPSQKMIIVLLQVLKYFCDNCFIQFQHFLRMQKTTSLKFNLHSVNMLERISDFLVRITKEMPRDIIFGSLSELVKVILNVLTEFVIGPCVDNQRLMIENRKFLDVVNTIFKIKSEEKSDKETKIASIQIIHQTSIFLESLVTGNEDQRLLGLLLDSLSKKHLKDQLLKIYILKVKSKKNLLFLDKYCSIVSQEDQEDDNKNVDPEKYVARCTKDYCREKKISYFDLMMVNTAFKIFLIIKQLEDRMPNNASLESLGLQKLANRPEFEEIRKKHSIYHLTEFSSKEKKLTNLNLNKIVNIKKANSSKVSALGNRAQKYTDQPIVEDDEDDNDTGKEEDTVYVENLQDEGEFENLGEDKEAILNFAQAIGKLAFNMKGAEDAQMLNEFFKYEKKRYYNEARQFFSSYVASLEINYEGTIQKVHFQIPYCCKFISKSIKRSAIREVNRNSDQERLESFYNKVKHYEFEMKRRQHMSQWRLIYFFIKHWKIINYVNFLLILGINILMVIYFEHSYQASSTSAEDYKVTTVNSMTNRLPQTSFPDTTARVVFNIMTYFQVAMAFIVLIFCAYEQYPIIHYNSSKVDNSLGEREKLKNTKFDDKLQAEVERSELDRRERIRNKTNHTSMVFSSLKDFDNIYNLCLFIISIISMWNYPLLYALLLFDLVKLSKTLSNIFMALLASSKLLVLMLLLSLIVLYFYSVLGFNYFPKDYLHEVSNFEPRNHRPTRTTATLCSTAL